MLKKSQIKFFFYFVTIFIVLFVLLYSAGFVPKAIKKEEGDSFRVLWDKSKTSQVVSPVNAEEPTKITIEKIGVNISIVNPKTTNIETLNDYLLQGAVRYPGSGLLGQGNMYLFAHSADAYGSIINPAYRAFDGLSKLKVGDLIKVYSATKTYTYKVTSVTLVNKDRALVEFNNNKNMLTLSTCNTFGATSDRYVVEAEYIN